MANEITIIGSGVTKQERNSIFVYTFGRVQIEAHPNATPSNQFYILIDIDRNLNRRVYWDAISDKLGAADIEAYVDALAALGAFSQNTNSEALTSFANDGIPLASNTGIPFSLTDRNVASMSGMNAGNNYVAYLFRAKAGVSLVKIVTFLFSFQATTNDDYSIEISLSPTFDQTLTAGMWQNHNAASGLELIRPGENGAPAEITINGYNPTVNGRVLLAKYGISTEILDSDLLTEIDIPENPDVTYCISIVPQTNGLDMRTIINWSEK